MTRFERALKYMLKNEGGLSDDPDDLGGATEHGGITSRFHPVTFWKVRRAKTPEERDTIIHDFYLKKYWNKLYNLISSERLAIRLFDLGVNLGVKRAVRLLQTTINENSDYHLTVDGIFGKNTLNAVNKTNVYQAYKDKVKEYYESRSTFWKFGRGWLRRLNRLISL